MMEMNILLALPLGLGSTVSAHIASRGDVDVPFHYVKQGGHLIMVKAKVNGQGPFDFIVDTGNGSPYGIMVSPSIVKRLDISTQEITTDSGFPIGLSKTFSVGKIESFELGEISAGNQDVVGADALAELAERIGAPIDGNLGYGFFKDYTLTFDFERSTLRLSRDRVKGRATPIQIGKGKPLIRIAVKANGTTLHFVLDTGASRTCISPAAAKELGLDLGEELRVNKSNDHIAHMSKLTTLTVAGKTQRDVGIVVAGFVTDLEQAIGTRVDGVLGHNFWSKYRLTIDYPGKRLLLEDGQ